MRPPEEASINRVRQIVAKTRSEQGLPPVALDDLTLGRVAALLAASRKAAA